MLIIVSHFVLYIINSEAFFITLSLLFSSISLSHILQPPCLMHAYSVLTSEIMEILLTFCTCRFLGFQAYQIHQFATIADHRPVVSFYIRGIHHQRPLLLSCCSSPHLSPCQCPTQNTPSTCLCIWLLHNSLLWNKERGIVQCDGCKGRGYDTNEYNYMGYLLERYIIQRIRRRLHVIIEHRNMTQVHNDSSHILYESSHVIFHLIEKVSVGVLYTRIHGN